MHIVNKLKSFWYQTKSPHRVDWLVALAVLLAALLLFSQGDDLIVITRQSRVFMSTIVHGQVLDYYTLAAPDHTYANYNPLVYLIYGMCYLPFQLLGAALGTTFSFPVQVLLGKLIVACWAGAAALLLSRLMRQLGLTSQQNRWGEYLFLTSPLLLFSSVLFGQIDIFYIVFMLAALLFFCRKRYWAFALLLSPAICVKWFAFFLLVPLILLVEKRIGRAIGYIACGLSGVVLTWLLYGRNQGYIDAQAWGEAFGGFKARLFVGNFFGQPISMSMLCFILVCVACYVIKYDDAHLGTYLWAIPVVIFGSLLLFYFPEPQWFAIFSPFLVLMIVRASNIRVAMLADSLLAIGMMLFSYTNYSRNVDNYMVNKGIIAWLSNRQYSGPPLRNLIGRIYPDNPPAISITVLTAGLITVIVMAVIALARPGRNNDVGEEISIDRGLVYLRPAIVVLGFMVPSVALFIIR